MTLRLLNQYQAILKEIPDLKSRIKKKTREASGHISVMASMDEPPYSVRSVFVGDPHCQEDIQATLKIMRRHLRRITRLRKNIELLICEIPDSQLRQIFRYLFIDGLSWDKMTMEIGGGNTKKVLQNKVYDYLKSSGQKGKRR